MQYTLGQRVRMLRTQKKLGQLELATMIGKTIQSISRIELDESQPRRSTLQDLANALDSTYEWLAHEQGEQTTQPIQTEETPTTWKDEAFATLKKANKHLEEEVAFLRELVRSSRGQMSQANFNNAFPLAGILNRNTGESVRAVA